jgi:hypothetical protein
MTSTASPYSPDNASSDPAASGVDQPQSASDSQPGYSQPGYGQTAYGQSGYSQPGYAQPPYTAPRPQQGGAYPTPFGEKTLSYVSFWLGVASVVLSPTVLVPVAAIVLGFLARTREPAGRTWGTWGIVLGFVTAFGWLVALVVGGVAALAALPFLAFL